MLCKEKVQFSFIFFKVCDTTIFSVCVWNTQLLLAVGIQDVSQGVSQELILGLALFVRGSL